MTLKIKKTTKMDQNGLVFLVIEAVLFNAMLVCFYFDTRLGWIVAFVYIVNIVAGILILFRLERKKSRKTVT